jgi:DNA-damage-inducible protein J
MAKSAMVRARIEPDLKDKAEKVLRRLGVSPTHAITLFYRQVELRKGLPFGVVIPKRATRKTFEDTDAGRDLIVCKDVEDMFKRLGI